MMSTITLYYNSLLNKDKNFILDDGNNHRRVEQYLATLTKDTINNFQYVKQALSITIKINMEQTRLMMGNNAYDLNYVKIQNGNENPCYYFIINKNWLSQNTIELVLSMDTLNSFTFNSDYTINTKTFVKREHKNRFSEEMTILTRNCVFKLIDLKSEEISVPLYRNENDDKVLNDGLGEIGLSWALYYANSSNQQNAPIDCFLVPESPINVKYQTSNGEIVVGDIPSGSYLMFFADYNYSDISIDVGGVIYTPETQIGEPWQIVVDYCKVIAILNDNGTLKVYNCRFNKGYVREVSLISSNPNYIRIQNSPNSVRCYQTSSLPTTDQVFNNEMYVYSYANKTLTFGTLSTGVVYGANSIDKTLSTNIKIINLPYSPTETSLYNGEFTIDSCWKYDSTHKRLKLNDFSKRFVSEINTNVLDIYNKIYQETYDWSGKRNGLAKRFIKDPKLLHSDFYRPKFVYDSFTKTFPLEQLNISKNIMTTRKQRYMTFKFVMSRNIVSKFLFEFDYIWNNTNEDYPNVVAVARNNEEVLYNSQYLDYIRTGYNYDLKAKERQEVTAGVGIGLNALALAASIGVSFIPGGQAIGVGSAIASGIGLVSQLVSYAKNTAQAEENIQRKLQESQRQSISVLNADDYDLLYEYSLNKAKMCYYSVSSSMEKILDDLFYYGGYVCNEQKVPNINTRYWFNYLQAILILNDSNNLTEEIKNDIKEKFDNGVTFLHYRNNKFDFAQEMENFEIYLIQ